MASFLLVFSIAAMGLIIFWYVFDEVTRDGQGLSGILGMTDPKKNSRSTGGGQSWKNSSAKRPWRIGRRR